MSLAKKACSVGNYQKGVDLLADLYVQSNEPVHVFNQGRCYEQNNRFEEALARFREFQRIALHLGNDERGVLDAHMAECEREVSRISVRTAPPAPAAAVPAAVSAPAIETEKPSDPPRVLQPPISVEQTARPQGDGRGLRVAGISTGLAGLVLVGAGVVFNVAANKADDQVRDGAADKVSTRNRYETMGWVSYGVGAAALVTGTILYVIGYHSRNEDSLSLRPSLGRAQSSFVFEGAF